MRYHSQTKEGFFAINSREFTNEYHFSACDGKIDLYNLPRGQYAYYLGQDKESKSFSIGSDVPEHYTFECSIILPEMFIPPHSTIILKSPWYIHFLNKVVGENGHIWFDGWSDTYENRDVELDEED